MIAVILIALIPYKESTKETSNAGKFGLAPLFYSYGVVLFAGIVIYYLYSLKAKHKTLRNNENTIYR